MSLCWHLCPLPLLIVPCSLLCPLICPYAPYYAPMNPNVPILINLGSHQSVNHKWYTTKSHMHMPRLPNIANYITVLQQSHLHIILILPHYTVKFCNVLPHKRRNRITDSQRANNSLQTKVIDILCKGSKDLSRKIEN